MLTITIINDNTGVDPLANYTYLVRSHYKVIASSRIEGHNPADGWKALALEVVAPGMLGACKSTRTRVQQALQQGRVVVPLAQIILEEMGAAIAKVEGDE